MIFYIFFCGNENPNNYGGITLSNRSEKLFNKMFNRVKHKLENKTYLKYKLNSWKDSRISDHIYIPISFIKKYVQNYIYLCTGFVNFQMAYNFIWREGG